MYVLCADVLEVVLKSHMLCQHDYLAVVFNLHFGLAWLMFVLTFEQCKMLFT